MFYCRKCVENVNISAIDCVGQFGLFSGRLTSSDYVQRKISYAGRKQIQQYLNITQKYRMVQPDTDILTLHRNTGWYNQATIS